MNALNDQKFFAINKTARAIVCALLFIPLVIAIIYGINVDPDAVNASSLVGVSVSSSESGIVFEFSDEASLELYSSMSKDARKIDKSFRDFDSEKPYVVTYTENTGDPIVYTLYMTKNSDDCVYVAPGEKYFMMDEAVAEKLIVREEFSGLNEFKSLPSATISGFGEGVPAIPNSYEWTYTGLDGVKTSVKGSKATENPKVKFDDTEAGFLKISFDNEPDSLLLTVTDGGEIVFEDKYENLSDANKISFTSDKPLLLTATAEWYELEGAEYYGKATYSVDLLYDVAPTYKIVDENGVPAGDFTVLRMSDFNDGEQLTIINDLGIPEKVNVYDIEVEDETYPVKIAFIPMSPDSTVGDHELTLRTDSGHEDKIIAKVRSNKEYDTQTLIIDNDALSAAFTEQGFKEYEELMLRLTNESVNEHLYDGRFSYPTGSSDTASGGASFGMHRKVLSLYSAEYTQMGTDLMASAGQEIKASNNGKVVFAGSTVLHGNTVIVDHGCGILSHYGNLESVAVSVGDTAVKGETVLGKAGSTGFACILDGAAAKQGTLTYFAFSFGGVYIDPASPCRYGVNF